MRRWLLRPRVGVAFAAALGLSVLLAAAALGGRSTGSASVPAFERATIERCPTSPMAATCPALVPAAPVEQFAAVVPGWQDPLVQQGGSETEPLLDVDTHNSDSPRRVDPGALVLAVRGALTAREPALEAHAYSALPDLGAAAAFLWPVRGVITSLFGPAHPLGIDVGAASSQPVVAAADGRVALVLSDDPGYGNFVVLNHAGGYSTLYAHFERPAEVRAGEIVRRGQLLGYVGSTGHSTGPHLHFEVRLFDQVLNPLLVLALGQLTLDPGAYDPPALTPTPTGTATITPTASASPTGTAAPSGTATPAGTATPPATPAGMPTAAATSTLAATATATASATPTAPAATSSATPTARPGSTGTPPPAAQSTLSPSTAAPLAAGTPTPAAGAARATATPTVGSATATPSAAPPLPSPTPSVRPVPTIAAPVNPTVAVPTATVAPPAPATASPGTPAATVVVSPSPAPAKTVAPPAPTSVVTVPPGVPPAGLPGTLTPTGARPTVTAPTR